MYARGTKTRFALSPQPLLFVSYLICQGQPQELLGALCYGYPGNCDSCDYGTPIIRPECITLSNVGMTHASSRSGVTMLEDLEIDKGYWRATNSSRDILECYNGDACRGGLTGAIDYCSAGYRGPCELARQDFPLLWRDRLLNR